MVPMPFLINISYYLQIITTHSSAAIANIFGIDTAITGNQIELANASFIIGTPCSGINSLISLTALGALLAFLVNGSFKKRMALFLLAIPIAIIANTIRIGSMLIVADTWGFESAINFFHDISGILLFLIAVALLLLLARILRCNFRTFKEIANE
jgi:exosortase